ncbi:hypothetical protein CEUSTIGMA_g3616.t1 [Chlamydomonas eustigma]|uniref:PCI domain-containing protein n=1 Tax=Chlamydomonas eustigma TaxID=1157962 RepID=A0A250WZX6_9CHLO|nr:hypothetical protein CEUSTIGMA_g3616.t1 [Chlamydomonas eustigma]|eukprot:GAX76172.1 hypothetical protein CEUSTIGMA_g3616.t1 [Chlamydomonas eustigma]
MTGTSTAVSSDHNQILPLASSNAERSTAHQAVTAIVALIESAVKNKDARLLAGRLNRLISAVRAQLTPQILSQFFASSLKGEEANSTRSFLVGLVVNTSTNVMQVEGMEHVDTDLGVHSGSHTLPEIEMVAFLLALTYFIDQEKFQQAKSIADAAVTRMSAFNRRTLDTIAAKIYYFLSLSAEGLGTLDSIRGTLLGLHCTAVLRHDSVGQEMLMNLLLRNYLHYNLYDQAEKFRSKAQKSDVFKSYQQYCRYLYFVGRIRTIQLEYTDAKESLQQAVRKAPTSALGFRVAASKWLILVRLLLGEVPDRQEFTAPGLHKALQPYLELTQAVRSGDLVAFDKVAKVYNTKFRDDHTNNLITRLHHNVLRTGLRRITLAYSRISLADVATKLHLNSAEDAECIVAKAIRDGGIDAVINHELGFLASKEVSDVYSTGEPQAAFHARIAFCLDLHNEAVKSMRYEPDAHKKLQQWSRKERISPEELAKAIADDDEEEY